MLVFTRERLVVLAVPKTGSTALAEALAPHAAMVVNDPPGLKHVSLRRYGRLFRPMLERFAGEMEVIAVMREPVDWLGSWYRYRQRRALRGQPKSTAGVSFDAFVRAYLSESAPLFARIGSQAEFLAPQPDGRQVDRLFRYEALDTLHDFLETRLGFRPDPALRNVSPKARLRLKDSTRAALDRQLSADFALWNSIGQAGATGAATGSMKLRLDRFG